MQELETAVHIKFTPRQWECIEHQLSADTSPEVLVEMGLGDSDGPYRIRELGQVAWELSEGGPTVTLTTWAARDLLIDAVQAGGTWVDLETCYAGNWDGSSEAAYRRVWSNAWRKTEKALGIEIPEYGSPLLGRTRPKQMEK